MCSRCCRADRPPPTGPQQAQPRLLSARRVLQKKAEMARVSSTDVATDHVDLLDTVREAAEERNLALALRMVQEQTRAISEAVRSGVPVRAMKGAERNGGAALELVVPAAQGNLSLQSSRKD